MMRLKVLPYAGPLLPPGTYGAVGIVDGQESKSSNHC